MSEWLLSLCQENNLKKKKKRGKNPDQVKCLSTSAATLVSHCAFWFNSAGEKILFNLNIHIPTTLIAIKFVNAKSSKFPPYVLSVSSQSIDELYWFDSPCTAQVKTLGSYISWWQRGGCYRGERKGGKGRKERRVLGGTQGHASEPTARQAACFTQSLTHDQ